MERRLFALFAATIAAIAFSTSAPAQTTRTIKTKEGLSYDIEIAPIVAPKDVQPQRIRAIIERFIDQLIQADIASARKGKAHFEDNGYGAEIVTLTPKLLSVSITVSQMNQGAAHPSAYALSLNYDLQRDRPIRLDEIFAKDFDYLGYLSRESRKQLTESNPHIYVDGDPNLPGSLAQWQQMRDDGTKPEADNFKAFNITGKGLDITFGEYQVAPYSEGMPTVGFEYEALKPHLSEYGRRLWEP
jgi:hypothetical protein